MPPLSVAFDIMEGQEKPIAVRGFGLESDKVVFHGQVALVEYIDLNEAEIPYCLLHIRPPDGRKKPALSAAVRHHKCQMNGQDEYEERRISRRNMTLFRNVDRNRMYR